MALVVMNRIWPDFGRRQDFLNGYISPDPAEFFSNGLLDREHHWRGHNALRLLHHMLRVAQVEPDRAGGPDGVV